MTDMQPITMMEGSEPRIFHIRGQKVMLDQDLAALYMLETDALNLAVARNIECFPEDIMFQLNPDEFADLKARFAVLGQVAPNVFTGQGLALLSSVLLEEHEARGSRESCTPACSCRR